jgi:DNA-binding CsgD family transcriptional regulator
LPATSLSLDPERLSRLVSLGYEAPILGFAAPGQCDRAREKEAWRRFAEEAARAFGCQLAMVEYHDAGNPERNFIAAGGLDGFEEVFTSARARRDEDTYLNTMWQRPAGAVQLGTDIVAPEQMHRTRSYSALAMPWLLEHFLMGTIVTGNGSGAFFSLGRAAREAPFVEGDKAAIASLVLSHLTRSMTTSMAVASMRGANAMLAAVMHQAPTGLVVFDGQGKPAVINQKATDIFAGGDGLSVANGGLRAENPVAQVQLDQALAAMLQVALGRPVPAPPVVLVTRRSGANPYRVSFSTLSPPGNASEFPRGSAVVAVIHDERRASAQTVPAVLRATYGLTRAEVRLCEALLAGLSLAEAATALNVSRNTAKTHLARVFDKTGIRSQMALLRLLTLGARA